MLRKRILWLCSWYPSRVEPFNGDFIQRHARAAALYHDIHVIHVWPDRSRVLKKPEFILQQAEGLTEEIILYPARPGFWGRIFSHQQMLKLYRNAIKAYYKNQGLPDVVHVQVPIKAGIAGVWMKKHTKLPMVVTEHWGIYNDIAPDPYKKRSKAFQFFTQQVFTKADACISPSRYLADGVNELVAEKSFTIIPNVVDTSLFYYKLRPANNKFRFLHVSNMVPLKNVPGILKAFKKFLEAGGDAELVMAGDSYPEIRTYAGKIGLTDEQVQFRGEISYPAVAAEMQQADCFILFSHIENSPCVIGEALCCGLPVIASRVGGVPELVDETNAVLVEAGNQEALALIMSGISTGSTVFDREKTAAMAKQKFSMQQTGQQMSELYEKVSPA